MGSLRAGIRDIKSYWTINAPPIKYPCDGFSIMSTNALMLLSLINEAQLSSVLMVVELNDLYPMNR